MDFQQWLCTFYKERNWYQFNAFIRLNFLTEEVGELAQVIRSIEIGRDRPDELPLSEAHNRENLVEELGDVFANLLILADRYQISIEELTTTHREKLTENRVFPNSKDLFTLFCG